MTAVNSNVNKTGGRNSSQNRNKIKGINIDDDDDDDNPRELTLDGTEANSIYH